MWWMGIAAGIVKAVGALKAGSDQEAMYNAYAAANDYNAAVARQRANQIRSLYGQRELQQRRIAALEMGERAAAIAQSGTGFSGSNADILRQAEIFAELDALNIRYEGELERTALLNQSVLDTYEGAINRASGDIARKSSYLGAAGELLGGFGSAGRYGGGRVPRSSSGYSYGGGGYSYGNGLRYNSMYTSQYGLY